MDCWYSLFSIKLEKIGSHPSFFNMDLIQSLFANLDPQLEMPN